MKTSFLIIILFFLIGCDKMINNPLIIGLNDRFDFKSIKPGHIPEATDFILSEADKIKNQILEIDNNSRSFDNTLLKLDDLYATVGSVSGPGYLMGSVHTDKTIREEGLASSKKVQNYYTDLSLNEELYQAVLAYSQSNEASKLTLRVSKTA